VIIDGWSEFTAVRPLQRGTGRAALERCTFRRLSQQQAQSPFPLVHAPYHSLKRRTAVNRSLATAIALTFALTGVAGLAQARSASPESTEVRFADLNLSNPAGQAALDRRIESAARRVCEPAMPVGSRAAHRLAESRCKAEVRQQVAAALPR
jgi:UrcA family protein